MSESYEAERKLFDDAVALPAAERAAFLSRACAGEAKLRARVESLLREHDEGADFLEVSPDRTLAEAARHASSLTPDAPGMVVGAYTLREPLGEGGCGIVYRATQAEPVRREVALKIIKLGMDTREVIARFEAERQALAMMEHPNIARVFDAGATETGRPYFVMELVRGAKITDYCDRLRLRPEERLQLFLQVCSAVQHAHQKGVVHRDLKPSNILVTDDGVPKVIDFGIAKATQGRLTDRTLFTAVEQFVGTPAYMSPEQAEGAGADVDTRSDIYSLGVLLYELLTGRTPIESAELHGAAVEAVRRRIREFDAPRPSQRVRTLDRATLSGIAERRQVAPTQLEHRLRGDLDWIAMRCLEKDRARRYDTVSSLGQDLARHLAHEPVLARPPGAGYVLSKFIRRHRVVFLAGGAAATVVFAGGIVSTMLYFREKTALTRAEANERKAEIEAARSAQVARFMQDMLGGVAPAVAEGRDTKLLRSLLDATLPRLDELAAQPAVQADLRLTLGRIYLDVDEAVQAEKLLTVAVAEMRRLHGNRDPLTAEALLYLGAALRAQNNAREALGYAREAVAIRRALGGERDGTVLKALNAVGSHLSRLDLHDEALATYDESLAIARKLPGDNRVQLAQARLGIGSVLYAQGKYVDSEKVLRAILNEELAVEIPGVTSLTYAVMFRLGHTLWRRARLEPAIGGEAERVLRATLAFQRKHFDEQHAQVPEVLRTLGDLLADQGRRTEALEVSREIVAWYRRRLEREPTNQLSASLLATALKNHGVWLYGRGDLAEAEVALREAVGLLRGVASPGPGQMAQVLGIFGEVLCNLRRLKEAEAVLSEGLDLLDQRPDWNVTRIAPFMFQTLDGLGKRAEMTALWVRLIARSDAIADRKTDTEFTTCLISTMARVGQHAMAEATARKNLARWEALAPDDWHVFAFQTQLGIALVGQGKYAEAEPLLLSGCSGLRERIKSVPTQNHKTLLFPYQNLVQLYTKWGKHDKAKEWQRRQDEIQPAQAKK